ncbi:uncharacterized protein PHALS_10856 [Plasmopara halstedii]|uniref:Uncharacterized protein n=1 Tax=Plasmopara halstedii TaxID=4781 RepID=A0A0P1AIT4_PLAHL|nr:uncharacterized protein PHALS_10856 [Plasmopara halstedii]CEG40670.1 hypothetical protein PHALS_10856 [Plasmopara halstedii]|eukprot:XP_024577039.1 hypothetical protein PHALS_10856 [Plasmopara halstedii]
MARGDCLECCGSFHTYQEIRGLCQLEMLSSDRQYSILLYWEKRGVTEMYKSTETRELQETCCSSFGSGYKSIDLTKNNVVSKVRLQI